jgi:double-stranded uracil-DNA glycosylase
VAARAPSLGFAPLASPDARVLVLGSLPGPRSLQAHEYYAHPQNAFWPVMAACIDALPLDYAGRVRTVTGAGIAVWDVLARAPREGALDSRIERSAAVPNDFEAFYRAHPGIRVLLFNGAEAARLYRRFVLPLLPEARREITREILPSTSPAHTLHRDGKSAAWSAALARYLPLRDQKGFTTTR